VIEQQGPPAWLPEVTQVLRDAFDRFVPVRRHGLEDFADTGVHVHEVVEGETPEGSALHAE
jgi:hypothetical protein